MNDGNEISRKFPREINLQILKITDFPQSTNDFLSITDFNKQSCIQNCIKNVIGVRIILKLEQSSDNDWLIK